MFWIILLLLALLFVASDPSTGKTWLPVIGATVGAFVSVFFSFIVKAKHEDRINSANLKYLLGLYREDLWNARGWLIEHNEKFDEKNKKIEEIFYFPIASWEMYKLTPDYIRIISELPIQKVKIRLAEEPGEEYSQDLAMLPTHLKNAFDHIGVGYNRALKKLKDGGILSAEIVKIQNKVKKKLEEDIRGLSKTIDCIDSAVVQLSERSKLTTLKRFFLFEF